MAKLSVHGDTIGTIEYIAHSKRYMSDRVILKNYGEGWKLAGKVKPGFSPEQAFSIANNKHLALLAARPALVAYRSEMHSMAGLSKRSKLHTCITLMPEDADGVWAEACDGYQDNVHADLDEIANLCALYLRCEKEIEGLRSPLQPL